MLQTMLRITLIGLYATILVVYLPKRNRTQAEGPDYYPPDLRLLPVSEQNLTRCPLHPRPMASMRGHR